jgi:DNA adenine methylase
MPEVICDKCGRTLKSENGYKRHLQRKTPCDAKPPPKSLGPLVKWSGGKKDEIKNFKHHIPSDIDTYIEPFVGGGAVYFHLQPQKAVINDVHTELVDFYRTMGNGQSQEIYQFMQQHPNEEVEYYKVRSLRPDTPLGNAQRFYYLRKTCFRGMLRYNRKGEFNIPYGRYKTYNFDDLLDERYTSLLGRTEVLCEDFNYCFETYNNSQNFMFLDPPYDSEFTDYGYCSFGRNEHERLAQLFKSTDIRCLMIIGATTYIRELYDGYIVEEYDKKYRFKIHSGRVGDEINNAHLVIKNYDIPVSDN